MPRGSNSSCVALAALAIAGLVALPPTSVSAADTPPIGALVDEPCDIEMVDVALKTRLRCARLHVLRDPADPSAGRFEIAVVVRRSATPKPGATPVLVLHGGPGGEITRWAGYTTRDFAPGHDTVLFDMRGGGRSRPFVCEGAVPKMMAVSVKPGDQTARDDERRRLVDACREEWQAAGLRGTHYGTDRNVADAEALREALGVSRWRLFGESYGTSVAAHYIAMHPERVDAAVLDSLYPPDDDVLPYPEMLARLADTIGADCTADARCAARFPGFGRARLADAVAALDAEPVTIGRGDSARAFNGFALQQSLTFIASNEAGARSLPFLVDAALRRDATLLAGPVGLFDAAGDGMASLTAMITTDCRDRARHHDPRRRDDPSQLLSGLGTGFCEGWADAAEAPRWPWGARVPMLVLSGGYDSFQPDAAGIVDRIGAAATHVHVPVASHGARGSSACVREMASRFLTDPAAPIDRTCIAAVPAPPFLTDAIPLSGPRRAAMAESPPAGLMMAGGAALLGLLVPVGAALRRRFRTSPSPSIVAGASAWSWLAAVAGPVALAAIAASLMPLVSPPSAVLLYGLPTTLAWIPWATLVPALLGAVALWRGTARASFRFAALAAMVVTLGLAWSGWSPAG
jgi:pimeloyl-ACP methyl ester carboxylesterase